MNESLLNLRLLDFTLFGFHASKLLEHIVWL